MTALTESRSRDFGAGVPKEPASHPVAASTRIFKGAYVCLNAGGYLVPALTGLAAGSYAGIAEEEVDNSTGANGDQNCLVRQNYTEHGVAVVGATDRTDIGTKVYASDSDTLTQTSTSNPEVGVIENVDPAGGFLVRGRAAALR